MSTSRGQSTIEYVGAILLVAVILAVCAAAIASPGVPRAVVAKLRLGLCIVGGDVCTSEDAAALGLEPCLLRAEQRHETGGVSFLNFRVGATDTWSAERRSDGTILLRAAGGSETDLTTGFGFKFLSARVGGDANAGLGFRSGRTWRVTEAQLRRVLSLTRGDPSDVTHLDLQRGLGAPLETFREGGVSASAALGLDGHDAVPTAGAEGRGTLGRRTGRDGTVTWYVDLGAAPAGTVADAVPGLEVSGHVGAEYRASDPPVLTLRMKGSEAAADTETVATLPLRTPEDRAAARRIVAFRPRDPRPAVRDLLARVRDRGTIQRNRYATTSAKDGWAAELALGEKLGLDHHIATTVRRLVAADILNGPLPGRRADCLGA